MKKSKSKQPPTQTEFEKLIAKAKKKKIPIRQCEVEDDTCDSCGG